MKITKTVQAMAIAGAGAIGLTAGGIWVSQTVAADDWAGLPAGVRATLEAQRPGEIPSEIEQENEDGRVVYEAEYRSGASNADITVDANGALVVVKTKIKAKDLPEAVAKSLEVKYPGAKVKEAESTNLGYYELDLRVDGKKVEIIIQADGTTKNNPEEDDADDEGEDEDDEA